MDTALYYTFTLYRLQLLQASMLEAATILRANTSADRAAIDAAYIVADYTRVFELVRAADAKTQRTEIRAGLEKFARLLAEKRVVLRTFQSALVASVLVILGSVIVLSFTLAIVHHGWATPFLAAGCISLGVCLGLYARLLLGHVA